MFFAYPLECENNHFKHSYYWSNHWAITSFLQQCKTPFVKRFSCLSFVLYLKHDRCFHDFFFQIRDHINPSRHRNHTIRGRIIQESSSYKRGFISPTNFQPVLRRKRTGGLLQTTNYFRVSRKKVTFIKFWRNQFAYVFVSNHDNDNEKMTSYTIKSLIIKFTMKESFLFMDNNQPLVGQ